jgi:hypothetical protein
MILVESVQSVFGLNDVADFGHQACRCVSPSEVGAGLQLGPEFHIGANGVLNRR